MVLRIGQREIVSKGEKKVSGTIWMSLIILISLAAMAGLFFTSSADAWLVLIYFFHVVKGISTAIYNIWILFYLKLFTSEHKNYD